MTQTFTKVLTFGIRPAVAAMLDEYVAHVRERMPESLRARVNRSLIVRQLLRRRIKRADTLPWFGTAQRFKDSEQVRIRVSDADMQAAHSHGMPYARAIAALILEARYEDGNYPINPDTKQKTITTEETL